MAAPATKTTMGTILGTPVVFLPEPTPWPMSAGCNGYIWRRSGEGDFMAFDPGYPNVDDGRGQSCYPAQQSSWFYQVLRPHTSVALGPTFVCPESYTSIHSTLLDSNAESLTQFTYCCPPSYTLNGIRPHAYHLPTDQCTSTVPIGSSLYFASEGTSMQRSFTVVSSRAATVYGVGVNGYNIVPQRQLNTSDTGPATENSKLPAGAIAGIAVAGVASLIFLGLVFWYIRKRVIKSKAATAAGGLPVAREMSGPNELPVKYFQAQESPDRNPRHELASQNPTWVHEMPSEDPTRMYEFPGHQTSPGDRAGYQSGGVR